VVMAVSAAFYEYLNRTASVAQKRQQHQVCLNLAEAGLDKALAELRARPGAYRGESLTPLGDGLFSVDVREEVPGQKYRITSTGAITGGKFMQAKGRVTASVRLGPGGGIEALRWMEDPSWR